MTVTSRGGGFFRTKSVEQAIRDTEEPEFRLRKARGPVQLTVMGIGVLIGTGVFVLAGEAAALYSGPAVSLSFLISGVVCALAALCYAEFASTVPVAGSAYTFSYASLGEFIAWMIGWDLILEFTLGAATVAKGWSGYFDSVLGGLGIEVPTAISGGSGSGGVIDLPAVFVSLLMMVVLIIGIRLSAWVNASITTLKLVIVAGIILIGSFYISGSNWTPFIPPSQPVDYNTDAGVPLLLQILGIDSGFGLTGVFTGAAIVFFAYLGFDIVATLSEEVKNPQRTMPIGIIASLAKQFGESTGKGAALRSAIGRECVRYDPSLPSHELGGVLVSAVFDAFTTVYKRKTARYVRLATRGSGVLPAGVHCMCEVERKAL